MPVDLGPLLSDLAADQGALRELLRGLDDADWDTPTPSPGWNVLHQVRHLAHGEALGQLAASDPAGFAEELQGLLADLSAIDAATVVSLEVDPPKVALTRWWDGAEGLRAAIAAGPPDTPIDWITGPMSRASFLTARVMETFAHGRDIADGLGIAAPPTCGLRHVAHLGVATRGFAFANRGLEAPTEPVRVELAAPDGDTWSWGPEHASDRVTGPALDFCLLVTRRRHRDDTPLVATGAGADAWLDLAECFAGPPSDGPPPSRR